MYFYCDSLYHDNPTSTASVGATNTNMFTVRDKKNSTSTIISTGSNNTLLLLLVLLCNLSVCLAAVGGETSHCSIIHKSQVSAMSLVETNKS